MGISTIQLKNHDGSIQVLTNVHYVPSLKENLILLGVLESQRLTIIQRENFKSSNWGVDGDEKHKKK